jgi:hypothetical protein
VVQFILHMHKCFMGANGVLEGVMRDNCNQKHQSSCMLITQFPENGSPRMKSAQGAESVSPCVHTCHLRTTLLLV